MKTTRLNNVFFPTWMFFLLAPWFGGQAILTLWLPLIFGNFVIDSLVIWIGLYFLGQKENWKQIWKKVIIRTFLFGFLSDLIGCGVSFLVYILPQIFHIDFLLNIDSWISLFWWAGIGVLVAALCIYAFNKNFSFSKCKNLLSVKQIKRISVYLAIFTAPYVMLIPSWNF